MSLSHGAVAAIVVLAAAVVFVVFCLVNLARAARVRYLPKWAWAPIICLIIPWGGLAYLIFGRVSPEPDIPVTAPVPAPVATSAAAPAGVPAAASTAIGAAAPCDRLIVCLRAPSANAIGFMNDSIPVSKC